MTDADLAHQLIAYVDATTEPVANPAARRNRPPTPSEPIEMGMIVLTPERTVETSKPRPIGWLTLAAAVMALIAIGLVITTGDSDEEPAPADQPAPTPSVSPPDDGETGAQPPSLAEGSMIGDQFVAALASLDVDAAAELLSSDATMDVGPSDDLDATFRWFDASGLRVDPEDCRAFEGGHVVCPFTQTNMWSDALGYDPVRGRVSLTLENGEIIGVTESVDPSWIPLVVDPFFEYVLENHPDDAASMWQLDQTGEERTGLIIDERSIQLFERHSEEYLEAMTEGS